eukprot:XP_011679384.1 PREDICTED: gamma-aminobutyric acid type B receptor subunit 1-like [Strongylocentrotus purpuratus]
MYIHAPPKKTERRKSVMMLIALIAAVGLMSGRLMVDGALNSAGMPGGDPVPGEIHFVALFPGGTWEGLEIAGRMAVADINANPNFLKNYTLVMHVDYTNPTNPGKPNQGLAASAFYQSLYNGPPKSFLIGSFYSEDSGILCETVKYWNVIQISFGAASPLLSDRVKCPSFYRIPQSAAQQNVPRLLLLDKFGWNRVAIIRHSNILFTATMENLRDRLVAANFTIVANELFDEDPSFALDYIKGKDARIIIGLFWEAEARKIFCEAYRLGMTGERYAWILRGIGYINRQFLTQEDPSITCTAEEMIQAGQTAIIPNWVFHTDFPGIIISGETAAENKARYIAEAGDKFMSFYTYPYDAVMAMAAAMNSSIETLAQVNKTLDNFSYDDEEMRLILMDQLDSLDVEGLSGPLAFENGDRLGRFIIEQVWDGEPRTVGYYFDNENRFDWSGERNITWIGDNPPHDEIFYESELLTMPRTVYAAISVLSYLGIILAFAFLAFNIALRNQRTIKLSSPNINNIVILGSIMTFTSVVLMGTDARIVSLENMDTICRARLWTLSLGFTLAFGAMFSKTFRVHKIFINKKLQKVSVKDYQLVVMVGGFVLIESVYLLVWDLINPLQAQVIQFTEDASTSEDRVIIPELQVCRRNGINSLSWLSGIYIFNGILLLFGLFLAFETRAVKIRALNDAKNIGISVYNVSILSSVGALFNLVMDPKDYTLVYIVTGLCVIVSTITTLLVIFLPKVIDVIKYPDGAPVSTMPDEFSTNLSTANANGGEQRKKPILSTISSKVGDGVSGSNDANGHPSSQEAWKEPEVHEK